MGSNFLGEVQVARSHSSIISANELMQREGVNLTKGMNFRDEPEHLSVFLVIERDGGFVDHWDENKKIFSYQGHDSTTVESGKSHDQILMYEDGRLTDNGRFYKAAHAYKDGVRVDPLQVQIYEKLDPGVWYDKGIFNLVDAKHISIHERNVYQFYLTLADAEFYSADDPDVIERMISTENKAQVWTRDHGRCVECGVETGLHFATDNHTGVLQIRCEQHSGRKKKGLLE